MTSRTERPASDGPSVLARDLQHDLARLDELAEVDPAAADLMRAGLLRYLQARAGARLDVNP